MTAPPDQIWIDVWGRIVREQPERCTLKWFCAYMLRNGPTLQAAIAAAEARGRGWHPIETAPKDGRLVLACHRDPAFQNQTVIYWDAGSKAFLIDGRWRTSSHDIVGENRFTHWQPLPAPPPADGGDT